MKAEQSAIGGWSEGMFGTFVLEKKKILNWSSGMSRRQLVRRWQLQVSLFESLSSRFIHIVTSRAEKKHTEVTPNSSRVCDPAVRSVRPRTDQTSRRALRLSVGL